MPIARLRPPPLTVVNTSRLSCDGSDGERLADALASNGEDEHLPCARHNALEKRALRLTGAQPP